MQPKAYLVASLAFAVAVFAAGSALAQPMSDYERAMLAGLSPALRTQVEQRMQAPGQKVGEVIDTILLNKISLLGARGKIVATDYEKKVVVAELPNGQMRVFRFSPQTLDVTS